MRNTVEVIDTELTENGFVLRYRTDETDDGLSGKEGTFLICSYWLVSALAVVGEMQRATSLMERLLRVASPLGLYAEEFEVERARHRRLPLLGLGILRPRPCSHRRRFRGTQAHRLGRRGRGRPPHLPRPVTTRRPVRGT